MRPSSKVIVSCAITGSIHTPTMSPYLPVSAEAIGTQAIDAARAGAAILHLHARVEGTGAPSQKPEDYARFLPRIRDNCDAVVNITTGGGLGMSLEDRLAPALAFAPELASMNMGSLNFNISGAASKIKEFQHDWERPYLEMTKDFILSNTFTQIERGIRALSEQGTRFEYECYDVGHLYNLAHFLDRGLVDGPLFVQGVFGILGGIAAETEHLLHMRRTADRLFGDQYVMSVLAAGRHQMPMAVTNATLGGHVRVGLEDSIYIAKGELAQSNAQQVEKITRILNELSIETATPDEARTMLGLKGAAHVKF
ncbi:MAG TPA: 3-keto-5-aminohexanoate cleavage protein [Paracoccus solventivorans]|uniref:3-keto-5-aminohexanoate cleavage protein n=1 Tax=Paracoccus solventivorans TaxID=53463 RepID=UPI002CC4638C|nr:3-keto-5-aminohexanoate cleavage protein [Paracoccus solventivorans]HMM09134.1 3-keto-5-aminohexanoate cleavage protein [Paracoccus solventivorans]